MIRSFRFAAVTSLIPLFAVTAFSVQRSLVGMDFGELMKVKVSSVERREKDIGRTPAAVFVLTAEDIRRSGATTIPDLLRGVPGITVARATGNTWAISSRGGADPIANKVLVLIDGRSVYTPLFAGVFWDVQDIPLETIERIEVIRGPGGAVWGANAVNGVINIIRKSAAASQGAMASVAAGDEERFIGNAQAGFKVGEEIFASVYGRYHEFDALRRPQGGDAGDPGHLGGGGIRFEGKAGPASAWLLSADGYAGGFFENQVVTSFTPPANVPIHDETTVEGANVMGRWTQRLRNDGSFKVQTYLDRTKRRAPRRFSERRHTFDLEAQHQFPVARIHRVSWGAGYRVTADQIGNSIALSFLPAEETDTISNVFVQDEIQLHPAWSVNFGTKVERNDYTGWEVQPSARTAWAFWPNHVLWAAVSRAVHTPTRIDRDVATQSVVVPSPLLTASIRGSEEFRSEELTAYELGYRAQPTRRLFYAVSTFYNRYDNLRGAIVAPVEPEAFPAPAHNVIPFVISNDLYGESFGGEIAPRIQLLPWWQLQGSYSYLHQRFHVKGNALDANLASREVADPVHQFAARSSWDVGDRLEFDAGVRWVGRLANTNVDDYTAIDARAGWRASDALTLELIGQNLFETSHREFIPGNEVEQSVFGKATWRIR